jgi:gliding motility-associated lipoprotein GldD
MNTRNSRQLLRLCGYAICAILAVLAIVALSGCSSRPHSPKPRGYFRIDLPVDRNYTLFHAKNYPYAFEINGYAQVVPDLASRTEPFWVDITYPQYNAKIHISYKDLRRDTLANLLEDVHFLVYKHTVKADAITEQGFISDSAHTQGFLYDIGGNAASNLQFYLTDQKRHFLRGSLYFNIHPNRDSLEPLILYISEDIRHLMETLRWQY